MEIGTVHREIGDTGSGNIEDLLPPTLRFLLTALALTPAFSFLQLVEYVRVVSEWFYGQQSARI